MANSDKRVIWNDSITGYTCVLVPSDNCKRTVEEITGKKIKLDEKFLEGLEFPEAVKLILSKTKFEKPKDVQNVRDTLTRLFIDRLHPILRMVRRVENTKNTKGQ